MTSTLVPVPEPGRGTTAPRRIGGGRIALAVLGTFSAVLGLVLLMGGTALLVGYAQRDDSGFFTAGPSTLQSDTYALTTPNLDVHADGASVAFPEGILGKARVQATGQGTPIFVGVGPTADVTRYLSGVRHDEITDVEVSPLRISTSLKDGKAPATAPGRQDFWLASDSGTGTRGITWDLRPGDWSVMVMNADGSADVRAAVSVGASMPLIGGIGAGLVAGGLVLSTVALGLVVVPLATARRAAAA
jgi:hypothetical protein